MNAINAEIQKIKNRVSRLYVPDLGLMERLADINESWQTKSRDELAEFFIDAKRQSESVKEEIAVSLSKGIKDKLRFGHSAFLELYIAYLSTLFDADVKCDVLDRIAKNFQKNPHLVLSNDTQLCFYRWEDKEKDAYVSQYIHTVLAASNANWKRRQYAKN